MNRVSPRAQTDPGSGRVAFGPRPFVSRCSSSRPGLFPCPSMSVRVTTAVWKLDQPVAPKLILLAFADYADDEGLCWPAISAIALRVKLSVRQVRRHVAVLRREGQLLVVRPGLGRYSPVTYQVAAVLRGDAGDRDASTSGVSPVTVRGDTQGRKGDTGDRKGCHGCQTTHHEPSEPPRTTRRARVKVDVFDWKAVLPASLDTSAFKTAYAEWLADRKERRLPNTRRAITMQLKLCERWGHDDAIRAIENATAGSWKGLFPPDKPSARGGQSEARAAPARTGGGASQAARGCYPQDEGPLPIIRP